jgi:hypothetical protein
VFQVKRLLTRLSYRFVDSLSVPANAQGPRQDTSVDEKRAIDIMSDMLGLLDAPGPNGTGVTHNGVHKMPSSSTIGLDDDEDMKCVATSVVRREISD